MPVKDGAPTAADLGQAFRMVMSVEMIPGLSTPWLKALNRGGEWTIDAEGAYAPFPGPAPADVDELRFVAEADGRIVGVRGGQLLALDPSDGRFRTIHRFRASDPPYPVASVARLSRESLTLVSAADDVNVLVGEDLTGWRETSQMDRLGLRGFERVFDIPDPGAVLFEDRQGHLALRFDGGRWLSLPTLQHGPEAHDGEYVVSVKYAPKSEVALLETDRRYLALRLSGGPQPVARVTPLAEVDKSRDSSGERIFVAGSAGEVISYRDANPKTPPEWRRLGPTGFVPIVASGARRRRSGFFILGRSVDLSDRPGFAFASDRGVSIYEHERIREAPGGEINRVGWHTDIIDLPTLRRTFVAGDGGLFELEADGAIHRLPAPFVTGGLPPLAFTENPGNGAVLVLARDGLFAIRRGRPIERVPGGEKLRSAFGKTFLGEIPVSHDELMLVNNALYLVTGKSSPRWAHCRSAIGSSAK